MEYTKDNINGLKFISSGMECYIDLSKDDNVRWDNGKYGVNYPIEEIVNNLNKRSWEPITSPIENYSIWN